MNKIIIDRYRSISGDSTFHKCIRKIINTSSGNVKYKMQNTVSHVKIKIDVCLISHLGCVELAFGKRFK